MIRRFMRLIRIEEARPGMKAARDVIDLRGNLLLRAGTEITEAHLIQIRRHPLTHLFIEDLPSEGAGGVPPSGPSPEEIAREVDRMFSGVDTSPLMADLREAAKRYLTGMKG